MNYSRSIKKKDIAKRIAISWLIFALIGALVGSVVAWACTRNAYKKELAETKAALKTEQEKQPEVDKKILVYGTYDWRIMTGEMSMDWGADGAFVPMDVPLDEGLQEFIYYLSMGYNIDFTFVMALIQQESTFNPDAVSRTGDYGLMQINQCNFEYLNEVLGIDDFLEPYNNIRGGLFTLRKLFEKYETPERVLMAYNMGEKGASKLWEQGIFETNHSRSVLLKQALLEDEYNYKLQQIGEQEND